LNFSFNAEATKSPDDLPRGPENGKIANYKNLR
jgi:hypothetical protein